MASHKLTNVERDYWRDRLVAVKDRLPVFVVQEIAMTLSDNVITDKIRETIEQLEEATRLRASEIDGNNQQT